MSEKYIAKVEYDEARYLADWSSILQDMSFTVDALQRLMQLLIDHSDDTILQNSLFLAALVSYARCFKTGKRHQLSEGIFLGLSGQGNPIECHRYYIDMRDKHIAHSVNPFEQVAVGIVLSEPESPKRGIEGVVRLGVKLMSFDLAGVQTLFRLALFVKEKASKEVEEWQSKTLNAGQMQSLDELYSNPKLQIVIPGPDTVGKARR